MSRYSVCRGLFAFVLESGRIVSSILRRHCLFTVVTVKTGDELICTDPILIGWKHQPVDL